MTIFSSIGFILFVLVLLVSLVLVPLGLPGSWLIVAASFVFSLVSDFQAGRSDFWVLFIVIMLALLGEALEFGIGMFGAKKLNVSNGAIVSSIIGGIVGALIGVPIFLVGALFGLFIGVFAGAFVYEMITTKNPRASFQAAIATFFSRISAMFVKTFVTLTMVIYVLMKSL